MAKYLKHESHTIDKEGNVVVQSKSYSVSTRIEPFYATFISDDQRLYGLTATQYQMLIYLCKKVHMDTGEVDITPTDRKKMMAFFDVSKGAISLGLKGLLERKILVGKEGTYVINPELFWKGSPLKRESLMTSRWFNINFKDEEDDTVS